MFKVLTIILIFWSFYIYSTELKSKPRKTKFRTSNLGANFIGTQGAIYLKELKGYKGSIFFDFFAESEKRFAITLNMGAGYISASNDSTLTSREIFIPFSSHLIYGFNNYGDFGIGTLYFIDRKKITPYFYVGYRYQPASGGFSVKAGLELFLDRLTDRINRDIQKIGLYGPVIGLGYAF
ncbi:MAG: hypothetical protein N3A01_08975 [Bacteroidales bacterium]|nr:hypothetical protein [Bacteroidales bacterium]